MTIHQSQRTTMIIKYDQKRPGFFSGYASTYEVDRAMDQIMPGAFKKTISTWLDQKGHLPHLYLEHDPYDMIGLCTSMKEDKRGLWVQGQLLLDIPSAQKAYASIKKGLSGLSIGFIVDQTHTDQGVRKINGLELKEISIVKTPCNDKARIHEYKNDHDPTDENMILIQRIHLLRRALSE